MGFFPGRIELGNITGKAKYSYSNVYCLMTLRDK